MHTNHLAYFVEVAKQGSISKAAKKLFISQPSLSASIAKLEEELGVCLFYRSQAGAQLTEQGEQILMVAEEVLKGVGEIQRIAAMDTHLTGEVAIAAIPVACGHYIADLIALAQKRYPHLSIVVSEERPKAVIHRVLKGNVNLGITSFRLDQQEAYLRMFRKKRLTYETLFEDCLCAYVGADHPLARHQSLPAAEINRYPLTCYKKDIYIQELVDDQNILGEISNTTFTKFAYQFSDLDSIKQIAVRNLAVAILPRRTEKSYGKDWPLVPITVADDDMRVSVGLIRPQSGRMSMAEQRMIEMLKEIGKQG